MGLAHRGVVHVAGVDKEANLELRNGIAMGSARAFLVFFILAVAAVGCIRRKSNNAQQSLPLPASQLVTYRDNPFSDDQPLTALIAPGLGKIQVSANSIHG